MTITTCTAPPDGRTAAGTATGARVSPVAGALSGFGGPVHVPGDDGYDANRAALHAHLDPRPALVAEATGPEDVRTAVLAARRLGLTPAVQATGPEDVRTAVLAARRLGLTPAVQATGHGTVVPADGGLLLKTSRMAGVLVDPGRAVARVGPGARWGDVIAAAAPFGLAPLSGSSPSVGVTGYTLGGGMGWMSRKYGFAADSLLRADLVTADGRRVTATAGRHRDLFWALRGGGGNFGVVTSLEFRLHPVERVHGGTMYFPAGRAAAVLARFREVAADLPDELAVSVLVMREAPAGTGVAPGVPVLAVRAVHTGDAGDAERALRPLVRAAGRPLHDGLRTMPYAGTGTIGGIAPQRFELFRDLPDAVVEAVVDAAGRPGAPAAAAEVRLWGGAIARAAEEQGREAGPAGHRDVRYSIAVDGPAEAAAALEPHATGGSFLNFLADPGRVHTAYTPANLRRLRQIKRAYDPDNLFRLNHNITPA
ncbi:FAD-binding oxidoreductase [Actinomadura fibrosa]|uniref:FAD-binding oxidoreductase n=1 Tax=Actinomadura fibrosa TaxID=111802 RepID=A0ABW2XWF2_9ACTN|nr:FAD-binding oxidoreductase [Actinomadura fibrosa]